MPSKLASRYGALAEQKVADEYGLILDGVHTSWKDAEFKNGTPVEIKACDHTGNAYFQIYKKYHRILRRREGWYGLAVYRTHGSGIRVLKTKLMRPSNLPLSTWTNTNHETRDGQKARLKVSDVF